MQQFWRILQQLVIHDSADKQLVFLSGVEARILYPNGHVLLIYDEEASQDHDDLRRVLSNVVRHEEYGKMEIIVVSNDDMIKEIIERAQLESINKKNHISFYTVDEKGILWAASKAVLGQPLLNLMSSSARMQQAALDVDQVKTMLSSIVERDRAALREITQFQETFGTKSYTATMVLLGSILIYFLLEEKWGTSQSLSTLIRMGANSRELVLKGEWWRLCTSVFLHAGWLHLVFNSYALVMLGSFLNRLIGGGKFLFLFLCTGFCGSLASVFLGHGQVSVGASGALFGLFGASAALTLRPSQLLPEALRARLRRAMIFNFTINLAISFLPMVDLWAHLGGAVSGLILGWWMSTPSESNAPQLAVKQNYFERTMATLTNPLAAFFVIIYFIALVLALTTDKPWQQEQTRGLSESSIVDDTGQVI